eukprot:TRINITY_DN1761_c0_g1_i2.p2 TRINITY_DN1761_c0_g1~~TRINITY_DN1761_c0_g1_i2.p2  ORF type:complete len:105 (-),score=15.72 TRINITY_DN1761_c0_g1_i2:832-1146(-)
MLSVLAACATTCAPRSKAASALRHSGPCACSLCRLGPPPTIARSKLTWYACFSQRMKREIAARQLEPCNCRLQQIYSRLLQGGDHGSRSVLRGKVLTSCAQGNR